MNYLKIFADSFQDNWERPALTQLDTGLTLDYCSVASRIARVHMLLDTLGVAEGDRVAVIGHNSIDWIINYLAAVTYGATAVTVPLFYEVDKILSMLDSVGTQYLFIDPVLLEDAPPPLQAVSRLQTVMSMDTSCVLASRSRSLAADPISIIDQVDREFSDLYYHGFQPFNIVASKSGPEATAAIFFTSGTSSAPKAVKLGADSLDGNIIYGIKNGVHPRGRASMTHGPLGTVWGTVFDMMVALASGAHLWVSDAFDGEPLVEAMRVVKPYNLMLSWRQTRSVYNIAMARAAANPLTRLAGRVPWLRLFVPGTEARALSRALGGKYHELVIGTGPMNSVLANHLSRLGVRYTVAYGLTETGGLVSYTPAQDYEVGTMGDASPDIIDVRLNPSPIPGLPSSMAELQVKGLTVMKGYHGDSEATANALSPDGWLNTGDIATLKGKTLTVLGAKDAMLMTPRGPVFPERIESILLLNPAVKQALVTLRGDEIVAILYPDAEVIERFDIASCDPEAAMESAVAEVNRLTSLSEHIDRVIVSPTPLAMTPKGTVVRYLYQ